MSLREEKARMRHAARLRRAEMTRDERARACAIIADLVCAHPAYVSAAAVAMYCDFRDEVETGALRQRALSDGKVLALPRVEGGGTLTLRRVEVEGALQQSPLGICEPTAEAPPISPAAVDLFLIPGLAFDRSGGRLGYGRGHYDRLLTAAQPKSTWMGLAFERQWVDTVPLESHDVRLHLIVTEAGVHTVP